MKLIFTKKQIIKALRTESLKQGAFFDMNDDRCHIAEFSDEWELAKTCKVCAVGAILRTRLSKIKSLNRSPYIIGEAVTKFRYLTKDYPFLFLSPTIRSSYTEEVANENYLGALSIYFESMKRVNRKRLVNFVEKNFPDKISVEL